jgi:hypothetical protein
MEGSENCNHQMEINDLIDDAITNALVRRGLVEKEETLLTLSEQETAGVIGGLTSKIAVAGFKPINPVCPPTKPTIKPVCPPIVIGLIALPDNEQLA